jgi:hypothetical protein
MGRRRCKSGSDEENLVLSEFQNVFIAVAKMSFLTLLAGISLARARDPQHLRPNGGPVSHGGRRVSVIQTR